MDHLRAFFENLAREWDLSQPPGRDSVINRLLEPFDQALVQSKSILDVGTGTGAMIPILQNRYPASRIISVDLAENMLRIAKRKMLNDCLVQSDVHALPFRDGNFACVICHNSFPHFWQKDQALMEIRRVLQVEGKLLILHDISREKVNWIHRNAREKVIHHDLLSEGNILGQMLSQAGYQLLTLEDDDTDFSSFAQKQ